jgi:RimJ/RimL family protein N-acetyltransferase
MSVRVCDDTDLIADLDRRCFPAPDVPLTRDELAGCRWGVAYLDGEPIGYIGYCPGEGGAAYLERYGVVPEATSKGVGKALLKWCARDARRHGFPAVYTYVFYYNTSSLRALTKAGYHPTHYGPNSVWVRRELCA